MQPHARRRVLAAGVDLDSDAWWLRAVARCADVLHLKRCGDVDAAVNRSVDRTVVRVNGVRALRRGVLIGLHPQVVGHVDATHDQDIAVLLDVAGRLRREKALAGWDLARFQRTAKGAGQSAGGRGDEVVERRIAWLVDLRIDAIVLGHRRVDTEMNWVCSDREEGAAVGSLHAFDPHLGAIHHRVSHNRPPSLRDRHGRAPLPVARHAHRAGPPAW